MMNIVEAALKYRQVTLAILLMLFAVGIHALLRMPRREDPKITIRQGLVMAWYPGANSVQVEEQVTSKLEQYLFQYEEVNKAKTWSTTKDGVAVINVELTEKVKQPDIFWNKLRHQLLISKELGLPQGVKGPVVDSDFGDTEAMVIALESKTESFEQLNTYAIKLEDFLRRIPSASKIKRIGNQQEEIVVSSSSAKLAQYGVKADQLAQQIQSWNTIAASGTLKTGVSNSPIYTDGHIQKVEDLGRQPISLSPGGSSIPLNSVAKIQRNYAEPEEIITVNGNRAIMLSIQMHEGNNIVDFGKEVQEKIQEAQQSLPTSIKINTLVSQPSLVEKNISHFIHEFFLAIISVIVVVILLLPLRIASVAAMAIPVTVALTFAIMNFVGIELHQVSLAALILVLGMVVDDAIVIADNYVELLDEGVERWTAAWRSAHDLIIPVLAATITIIASFIPMLLISGSTGEFIATLPVTVAISLVASYFVALFLTPILCYAFIKKGLHSHDASNAAPTKRKRKSVLTYMQEGYERLLHFCIKNPRTAIVSSFASIGFVLIIMQYGLRELFFPPAERNQFIVELWMPTGTQLEKTNSVILKAEELIKNDNRVTSYATFTGTSAPRFYYNFTPEFPTPNYAMILINTTTDKTAEELTRELSEKASQLTAQGKFFVKLMQQGSGMTAPVEVRIVGNDIERLKTIRDTVSAIIKNARGSSLVRDDFSEDYYAVDIKIKEEARRLGFTTTSVAQSINSGFSGAPITTIYEGKTPVNIVLRLNKENRQNTTDIKNTYLHSSITGTEVPLRQIADLVPSWHTGKIMHRNGVRTLTVQSETQADVLPAEILEQIKPQLEKLPLPPGYRIEYGGEEANKDEVFIEMVTALLISLVLIFIILLFQFKSIKEAIIIMLTIPLSLFGAVFGLYITKNPFSFTAFIGLIALSGIVVRNAIILVDYTNTLIKQGFSIRDAAIEAAKRRLRPIFLTAMAAAVGVLPMIISGSGMWAPLASVLAFGVIWSMIMALITVPILYIGMIKPSDKNHFA